jgi:CheY-like chemotaxis protein
VRAVRFISLSRKAVNNHKELNGSDKHNLPILLVEDDDADVLLLERAFEELAIKNPVHRVKNGEQAMEYLSQMQQSNDNCQHLPALILLDINVPRMGGLSVLKEIKQNQYLKRLPVVMLTTSSLTSDIDTAYDRGANSYLIKPVKYREFVGLIDKLNQYWLEENAQPTFIL